MVKSDYIKCKIIKCSVYVLHNNIMIIVLHVNSILIMLLNIYIKNNNNNHKTYSNIAGIT